DWSPFSHSIAIGGELKREGVLAHIILNAYWEPLDFELPILREGQENWWRWIDTALDPPHEICERNTEKPVLGTTYRAGARSAVVLLAGEGRIADISAEVRSTLAEVPYNAKNVFPPDRLVGRLADQVRRS
ncbi:MAG: hypothetical protein JO185_14945, partial [Acidobacteriaceae bacterium]|nr:hypothetical protein [Acidobacteriaceae bacterium]